MMRNPPQTDSDRRPRTISLSLRDRGQTTQDFAVGIGVFILAVAFVFSFLPTLLTPFDSSVTGGQTAQADRIADRIVHNLSNDTDGPTEINGNRFEDEYVDDEDGLTELGIRADQTRYDRINVRLEHLDGRFENKTVEDEWTAGDEYQDQSAASAARIVTVENGPASGECEPACRLVVRMW